MKRLRVNPEAVRKANREAATKKELIKALEVINNQADEEEQHKAGVHRFIVNTDCTGDTSEEACYITCSWCYEDGHPVENTDLDPTKTNGSRICFNCLDKMNAVQAALVVVANPPPKNRRSKRRKSKKRKINP